MKLWSKTLIASAVCLFLAGCDDSSKVDANLDKAKDNAQQIKEAASDKADAIKDEADKHIDAIKNRRRTRPTISAARPPASRRRRIKKRKQLLSRPRPRLMPSSRMPGRKATKSCRKLAKLKTARLLMPITWPTMRRIKQKKLKRVSLPLKPQKMRPMRTSRHHTDYFSPSALCQHYLQRVGSLKIMWIQPFICGSPRRVYRPGSPTSAQCSHTPASRSQGWSACATGSTDSRDRGR